MGTRCCIFTKHLSVVCIYESCSSLFFFWQDVPWWYQAGNRNPKYRLRLQRCPNNFDACDEWTRYTEKYRMADADESFNETNWARWMLTKPLRHANRCTFFFIRTEIWWSRKRSMRATRETSTVENLLGRFYWPIKFQRPRSAKMVFLFDIKATIFFDVLNNFYAF